MLFVTRAIVPAAVAISVLSVSQTFGAPTLGTVHWKTFQKNAIENNTPVRIPEIPDTVEKVQDMAKHIGQILDRRLTRIAERPGNKASFENTVLAIDEADRIYAEATSVLFIAAALNQNTPLYAAAMESQKRLYTGSLRWLRDQKLREAVDRVSKIGGLTSAEKAVLEHIENNFEKLGNLKELVENSKLAGLWERLHEKQEEFEKNILAPVPKLAFTVSELDGASETQLASLKRDGDRYLISPTSWNETELVYSSCNRKSVRDRVLHATRQVGYPANLKVLREMLALRREIARLLKMKSWANYQLMGFSVEPSAISRELSKALRTSRQPFLEQLEIEEITEKHSEADFAFMAHQKMKAALPEYTPEYFPLTHVLPELLKIFSELYSIDIVQLENAPTWHKDVLTFGVTEGADKKVLGVFSLDLFPREGKDEWFWNTDLVFTADSKSKGQQAMRPYSVINGNFPRAVEGMPPLMKVEDVTTLAHEIGHTLHTMMARSTHYNLLASHPLNELREIPSTYLELLVQSPPLMRRLSQHWKTGKQLDLEVLEKFLKSKRASSLVHMRKKSIQALLDLKMHSGRVPKLDKLEQKYFSEHGAGIADENSVLASFGYAYSGYDALYWTYLWSQAIALHMVELSGVTEDGHVAPEFGSHVRRTLLEKDGEFAPAKILKELLGGKPKLCHWLLQSAS